MFCRDAIVRAERAGSERPATGPWLVDLRTSRMHRRTCSTATKRVGVSAVWVILVSCGALTPVRAVGADDLTAAWQRQLAQIESGFRTAKAEDAAVREEN